MENLEKDLISYAKDSKDMKDMEKDMKKGAKEVEKDLEKYARDVKKAQDKEAEQGFMAPSDISFTGTDAYTYIRRDYHELNPIKVQKVLDKQNSHKPWILSSWGSGE